MNDPDPYNFAVAKTRDRTMQRSILGKSGEHYLDEYLLDKYGWIGLYQPLKGQRGSPALVAIESTHSVRPRLYDGHVDNIELHMLNPREVRNLSTGDYFELHYLLVTSPETDNYDWIDKSITRAKSIIDLTETLKITVLDVTNPMADAGRDQTVKVGETVSFDASGSSDNVGIVSYEWDFGDGTTGTDITTTHTYTEPGTYTVTLTVKDEAGNTDTDTRIIMVEKVAAPFPWWIVGVITAAGIASIAIAFWRRGAAKSRSASPG